ncbi:MAG: hypothetical protein ABID35_01450 [Candidatus Margulisiibacteriota bacterium]
MTQQPVDKRNYDVALISRPGQEKRATFVQDALHIEKSRIESSGQFISVFANMFRNKTGHKAYF